MYVLRAVATNRIVRIGLITYFSLNVEAILLAFSNCFFLSLPLKGGANLAPKVVGQKIASYERNI